MTFLGKLPRIELGSISFVGLSKHYHSAKLSPPHKENHLTRDALILLSCQASVEECTSKKLSPEHLYCRCTDWIVEESEREGRWWGRGRGRGVVWGGAVNI